MGVLEPGGVDTELGSHNSGAMRDGINSFYESTEVLQADDIADGVAYMVTRPRHASVSELWIMTKDVARRQRRYAILRQLYILWSMDKFFAFGPFEFNEGNRLLRRDGVVVALGQRGAALLGAPLNAEGQPVSKNSLFEHVARGDRREVNLTVQIAARKALGPRLVQRSGSRRCRAFLYCLALRPDAVGRSTGPCDAAMHRRAAVRQFLRRSGTEYLADGVVEDVITALSRFRSFAVIAATPRSLTRGGQSTPEQWRDLAVRYVLEAERTPAG